MSKKELIEKLTELFNNKDTEESHIYADKFLIDYINDEDIKMAYNSIHKWYA